MGGGHFTASDWANYASGKVKGKSTAQIYRAIRMKDEFRAFLDLKGYVLLARTNDRYNHLIELMPGEKMKYLSMWKGYVDKKCIAFNPTLAEAVGDHFEYLHTSGHCDMHGMAQCPLVCRYSKWSPTAQPEGNNSYSYRKP